MKKLLFTFAVLLATISMQAQIAMDSYTDSHSDNYKITLLMKNEKPAYISVDCKVKNGMGAFWIKPNEVAKFRAALVSLKEKYVEWTDVAKANNVTEASKEMPIKFPKVTFVWGHSTTFFADAPFKAQWLLNDPVSMVVCIALVKDMSNKYIDETFSLRFYNADDIQALIDALSQSNVDAAIQKANNSELFN